MKILAFETASGQCSVALGVEGEQIAYMQAMQSFQQSEELFPIINKLLVENKIVFQALDAVAVNVGPGSFTGVRIGVAAAKGLKLVLPKIKLIGVTTLELLADIKGDNSKCISIMSAGRNEYYVQVFNAEPDLRSDILCLTIDELLELFRLHQDYIIISSSELDMPGGYEQASVDAGVLLSYAFKNIDSVDIADNIAPLYIKPPNITIPKQVININK